MKEKTSKHSLLISISKIISNFFNPIVSLIIYYIVFNNAETTYDKGFSNLWALLLILALPCIVWIIWNVKKGRYTNMDVSNREQRKSLYVVIVFLCFIYLAFEFVVHQHLDYEILFLWILLILMQISNFFIKSSMHTSLNIFVAFLFLNFDIRWGIFWFILSIIIGITRIILKRHTLAEVISGGNLACLVGVAYYLVN
ncbi:ABC transporter permease [Chryseobacterium sp. POL2]|uniref:ABC transporter permease n=1 Tax=Chryseobacterium sp. POL2 TaxID=2713414 RepID=UPI0013E14EE4|nr:ABC transporter permease [Chryseobacterium sp. POL2]QIG88367.1 ABC transporter permease [Chryseobacterium sp. POL2]